jgi:hypothetical protein
MRSPRSLPTSRNPPGEPFLAYEIMVFAVEGGQIAGITGFADCPKLLPLFGLLAELS